MATGLTGLSEIEAAERLRRLGFNELPSAGRQSWVQILIRVLKEPMLLLLLACGLLYLLAGEPRDGVLLFVSAVVAVSITLYQEVKSERALEALRDLASPRALVIREGVARRVPGREVVPGDLLQIFEGDRVSADAEIRTSTHLSVDESLLTGESFPVSKLPSDRIFSGTLAVGGQALAIVSATGLSTELGKIGRALAEEKGLQTSLQREISRVVRIFGVVGTAVSVAIAAVYGITRGDWLQGALAGLAAAMSLLPEEFPVVMTIFLAMGAWRISRKKVLTRRMASIEALGAISALCVDKTGTLTQNKMSVREMTNEETLRLAALACHDDPFDPMEKAILERAALEGGDPREGRERGALYPLSPGQMSMAGAWKEGTGHLIAAKGAPEAVAKLCRMSEEESARVHEDVRRHASRGLRVLAVAESVWDGGQLPKSQSEFHFSYRGTLAFEDPIRPEVPAAVRECQNAGIRVLMLTGDYPETARSIAERLGLPDRVVLGNDLSQADDARVRQLLAEVSVFARVTPEQKLRIVKTLKAMGEYVAMTGDGVNDAPSLKAADIGVAMGGRGTDVAREAAAIVLLDDSFASIVAAIRLGRRIRDNLDKAIFFILAVHVSIAGLAMLPVFLGMPLLLFPAHIVFLELIIDPACSLVYEAETEEPGVMSRKPRRVDEPLLRQRDLAHTGSQGGVVLVLVLGLYSALLGTGHPASEARAAAFVSLIVAILALILVERARAGSLLTTLRRGNLPFAAVVTGSLALLTLILAVGPIRRAFAFSPLSLHDLALAVGVGALSLGAVNVLRWNFVNGSRRRKE